MNKQSKGIIESNRLILEFLLERAPEDYRLYQPVKNSFFYFQRRSKSYDTWTSHSSGIERGEKPLCFFHSDWNQIMWVIDEIKKVKLEEGMITVSVKIDNYGCTITNGAWQPTEVARNTQEGADVKTLTYKTIVDFINYYNNKKK